MVRVRERKQNWPVQQFFGGRAAGKENGTWNQKKNQHSWLFFHIPFESHTTKIAMLEYYLGYVLMEVTHAFLWKDYRPRFGILSSVIIPFPHKSSKASRVLQQMANSKVSLSEEGRIKLCLGLFTIKQLMFCGMILCKTLTSIILSRIRFFQVIKISS